MKKLTLVTTVILSTFTQNASAHPGPPGHTHGDEWPFGAAVIIALAVYAIYNFVKKFKQQ